MKDLLKVVMILVLLTKLEKLLKYKILIPIDGKNVQEEYTSSLIGRKQLITDEGELLYNVEDYWEFVWTYLAGTEHNYIVDFVRKLSKNDDKQWVDKETLYDKFILTKEI